MDPVVILATETVSAAPGGEARLPVRVRNQGRRVESYAVEVVGEPSRFSSVEPASVSVLPGKEAEITITFRPPVGASTPTGSLPFAVRVVSEVGTSSSAVAEGRLELAGAAGLQAWADTTSDTGRWSARYRLVFSNQGNAPARLFVAAHDPAGVLRLVVRDEVVSVPPGAQVDTEIRAKARQPFLRGATVNRVITASCSDFPFGAERPAPGQAPPKDDPNHRTFQLTFQQKPILSKLTVMLVALALAGAVAFAVLRLRGGEEVALGMARPQAPPTFSATPAGSTAIFLTWSRVPNAAGYDVRRTTAEGQVSGPALGQVDASTLTFTVEGLGPGEQHCFAVEATGPEGVDNSPLSDFACATTDAAPTLSAPANFVATEVTAGTFEVRWEYPGPIEGTTFTVFVDNEPLKPGIAGLFTTLDVPRRELTYDATLAVKAVSGDQTSDFSNAVVVTVPALPVTASTAGGSVPGGATTTAPGGGAGGPGGAGGGGGGGGATTTTAAPQTTTATATTVPTPAQGQLQDLEETWVAWLGPVVPPPAGPPEEAQRATLSSTFGVAPEQVLTFSNRDTAARDASGAAVAAVAGARPSDRFFYVVQPNEAAAAGFCRGDIRCRPMILEGAANAAEGTHVLVLDRVDATTTLADVDELVAGAREELARPEIHVLDGARRAQFGGSQLVVFASGFASEGAVNEFCVANGVERCTPVVLEPDR